MLERDLGAFQSLLTGALAYWRQDVSEFTLQVWWDGCRGFELEQVSKALSGHAADPERGRFPPMLADVVRALQGTHVDRSLLAWGRVHRAMSDVGAYRSVVFDDPAIHAAIADLGGWTVVCRSTIAELPHLQRRFCEAHRTYSTRGAEDWPPVLIGDSEAANRGAGCQVAEPVLIGEPAGCERVRRGPPSPAALPRAHLPQLQGAAAA